jgi:hypothetical protein
LREAAEKEMDRFTRVADYDVRRNGPKSVPVSLETGSPASALAATEKIYCKVLRRPDIDQICACSCGAEAIMRRMSETGHS